MRYGRSRPRSPTMTASDESSSQVGPGASSVMSRSHQAHSPTGRSRAAVRHRGAPDGRSMTHSAGGTSSGGSSTSVPMKARRRPSGEKLGRSASPARLTSSRTRGRAAEVPTDQIWVRGLMVASVPRSAAKAIRVPSGDHAGLRTSKSPLVSWRGFAPARGGMTHRWARRTTCPDSSSRKSRRVMRRATGARPFRSWPITNRWSPACATSARRCPSGLQCTPATPCFSVVSCHGSPPSSGRIQACPTASSLPTGERTKATRRPSGEMAGAPSRTRPRVSSRGRPPRNGRVQRWDSYSSRTTRRSA
jgi:hypothetical protein